MTAVLTARLAGTLGSFALDIDLTAPLAGITVLYGPSGCGKTTTLRCIAGLHCLNGKIAIGDDCWQDDAARLFLPTHRRPIGFVFQDASLFPHLSVRDNLVFGFRRAPATATLGFDAIVDLLGLVPLLDRGPRHLSGGERQRVAMGRALLSQPRLLLMDEPLAGLDRATKEELLPYLQSLPQRLSIPIVYVTHDLAEVERLAHTLVLMDRGRVLAAGPLAALETDPRLPLVHAREAAVMLDSRVTAFDAVYALTTLAVDGGAITVPGRVGPIGHHCRLRIGVSDVSFVKQPAADTTILNCLPATISAVHRHDDSGSQVNIVAALGNGGAAIVGRVTRKSQETLGLNPGATVFAQIKSVTIAAS